MPLDALQPRCYTEDVFGIYTMHVSDVVKNFAVHGCKVFAVGFNYKLHAEELKNTVPTQPFYFLKSPSTYVTQVLQYFVRTVSE